MLKIITLVDDIIVMNIDHLSISRSSLYQQCGYKYKLKYHLKIKAPKTWPWFLYGTIIHKIIEIYTANRGKIQINDIANSVLKTEKPLTYNYQRQLPEDLSTFQRLSEKIGFGGETEVPFSKDLDPPNNKCIIGFCDRIIEKKGIYYVLDWKTTKRGEWQKTEENIVGDIQLQVYAHIIAEKMKVDASKVKAGLYYLQGAKMVAATFSQKTLDEVPEKMLKIYNQIVEQEAESVVGNVGDHCGLCEYADICPFFKALR